MKYLYKLFGDICGMLECGKNYKGSLDALCKTCKVSDNENHRLNDCTTHRKNNDTPFARVKFDDIYSCDKNVLIDIMKSIEVIWNTKTAHGSMKS